MRRAEKVLDRGPAGARSSPAAQATAATASSVGRGEEPGDAVVDDLGGGAAGRGDDRRAAGQGLDHAQPEGLVPPDGVEQRHGSAEQRELRRRADLAHVADVPAEERLDLGLEVLALLGPSASWRR